MRDTFLPYCRPDTGPAELAAVGECIANGWLTTGPKVQQFEAAFAQAAGVKHAIALNSCTAALHVSLIAAGVGPGDEVVTPSLTFVAGAQCAVEIGARPVFCDVDAGTLTSNLECIRAVVTPRTRAIVVMPYAGRPMNVGEIVAFAAERGIAVIEDAAHAVGMLDRGQWPGTRSTAAAYSFYATKNLTTAEGGMLVTNDDAIMERVRALSLHGMDRDAWKRYSAKGSWRYDVREPGFKYNMPDIAAAMGLAQLHRLDAMQHRRDEIARRYSLALSQIPGMHLQDLPAQPGDKHSWCMFVVRIDSARLGLDRDELIERMKARNIGTSVHYIPTHLFGAYRHLASDHLTVTNAVWRSIISLPLYPTMSDRDVDDVLEAIRSVCAVAA